ncbi:MAG: hypothetical protein BZ137_02915 [Methanosphaera sp. rholeuAM130]|nr:hypothetical protein [Methanosphaera sp.]RAP54303.1 MAG: hypothetical protein BZ137_02915 [Methanosphaera sp. rholeuAM130]
MIIIKAEIESRLFILLLVGIVAIMFGSIASIFIHFDNIFEDSNGGVSSILSDNNSNSDYYNSSSYNSNGYNRSSYYNSSYDDENATLSDRIKEYLNDLLNNDDK